MSGKVANSKEVEALKKCEYHWGKDNLKRKNKLGKKEITFQNMILTPPPFQIVSNSLQHVTLVVSLTSKNLSFLSR